METAKMKLALSAGAVALSMALAGCGGGSSGGSPETPANVANNNGEDETGTTRPADSTSTPSPVRLPTDGDSYLDSMVTLDDTTAPVRLATDGTHTAGHFTFTCTAGPCQITIEDGEVSATGTVSVAYSAAAQETIDDGKMVAMAEKKARVDGLFNALTDDPQRGQAILAASSDFADLGSISRGQSGEATVTVGPFGGAAGWKAEGAPSTSVTGWAGHTLERKTQRYVIYTNIDAAKRKSWGNAYVRDSDGTDHTAPTISIAEDGTLGGIDFPEVTAENGFSVGTITLTNTAMARVANAGLLDPDSFPKPGDPNSGTITYTYNDGDGANDREAEFDGTFHGASGKYQCTTSDGDACTVTVTAPTSNGHPVYSVNDAGRWRFQPDTKNNPQIVEQDTDHMHFGWWINTPSNDDGTGVFQYDVQVFSGGQMSYDASTSAFDALTGTVSYEGPAAGLYAIKAHKDADDMDVPAAHGEFSATASLTADFDNATNHGDVSGKIEDFVRDDGVTNDWSLTLKEVAIPDSAGDSGRVVDGSDAIGAWHYQLYGSDKNGARPSGIAGGFNAAIDSNTAVAGGFAATQ